jgi:hypothetical protein
MFTRHVSALLRSNILCLPIGGDSQNSNCTCVTQSHTQSQKVFRKVKNNSHCVDICDIIMPLYCSMQTTYSYTFNDYTGRCGHKCSWLLSRSLLAKYFMQTFWMLRSYDCLELWITGKDYRKRVQWNHKQKRPDVLF